MLAPEVCVEVCVEVHMVCVGCGVCVWCVWCEGILIPVVQCYGGSGG